LSGLATAQTGAYALPAFLHGTYVEGGHVPHTLPGAKNGGVLWQAEPQRFLLRIPGVAAFLVESGSRITIDQVPLSEPALTERFLRMTPLAALLYQRGHLVFHAAAAANTNGAILLAGDSGAGKSTLLMALVRRGWKMLADELAVVVNENGRIVVLPTFPEIRLWQNATEKFSIASETASGGEKKWHVVAATEQFSSSAQPLLAIYSLGVHNADRIDCRLLGGMDRFRTLGTLTYNSHIADALLDRGTYMHQASSIAQAVPMHRFLRPRGKWTVDQLADQIEERHA
jgi:hypothetical protein